MTYTIIPLGDKDFMAEVSMGDVSGYKTLSIFSGTDVFQSTDGEIDVWADNSVLQYLSSAEPLDIVSSSANDSFAGTGARTVQVMGLDNDYLFQTETVEMNGLTPVQTVNSYIRVRAIVVLTSGNSGTNVGSISATASVSATLQAKMLADYGASINSHYTCPANKVAMIKGFEFSAFKTVGVQPKINFRAQARPFDGAWITRMKGQLDTAISSDIYRPQLMSFEISPKTDIKMKVETNLASSQIFVRAYILEKDNPA